ncbi:MAG: HEPN domain-containing protein [Deltaproteobacteria bacterium]|nr:HEPN domain-containing protein [Deltaproteobacteria bacterium]
MEFPKVFCPSLQAHGRTGRDFTVIDERLQNLIRYRIERARETLEEALLMQREGHWNSCANRLYYACYYAVTALLATKGLASSKHTGIKALFNQHFVKTGLVQKENGRLYNRLFDTRQEGDYVDFVVFERDDVEPLIPQVKDFIETISQLAQSQLLTISH